MKTITLNVDKLTDTNSAVALKNSVISVRGVSNAAVNIDSSNITITFDNTTVDIHTIEDLITNSGFKIR